MTTMTQGIRVLSLDGGGIRGASIILILKEIMHRLAVDLDLDDDELKPCQVFDLIGGSGTGGIIALLLGRFDLTVEAAISEYSELSAYLWSDASAVMDFTQTSRDELAARLETKCKEMISRLTNEGPDALLYYKKPASPCKTFVVAMSSDNLNGSQAHLFRNYRARSGATTNCPVWQAIRATTADRNFFKDISIGPDATAINYVGTEYGNNNPTKLVMDEVKTLYKGQKIHSVMSIGAGHPGTIALPDQNGRTVQAALTKVVQDCTTDAILMAAKFDEEEEAIKYNPYSRFSVEQGMQNVSAKDFDVPQKVAAHVGAYLREKTKAIDLSVTKVMSGLEEKVEKQTEEAEMMMLMN